MTDQNTSKAAAEIVKQELDEDDEWEFVARINVRITNPDGEDVLLHRRYKARPKMDDLTNTEGDVHESTYYWWTESYPSQGDSPFRDAYTNWEPTADLDDDEELMQECLDIATHDPTAELDALIYNVGEHSRAHKRLTGET